MDRRTLLALVLMALVIVITPRLFSSKRPVVSPKDTIAAVPTPTTDTNAARPAAPAPADSARVTAAQPPAIARRDTAPRENVTLATP